MRTKLISASALVCLLCASASGAPVINVGLIQAEPDTVKTFAIEVTGGDPIQGLDLYVQVGDGGLTNGGTDAAPVITAVDITGAGTLFAGNNNGQSAMSAGPLIWSASTTTASGTVAASGVLGYVTIDTTGTQVGQSYDLLLSGVGKNLGIGPDGVETAFAGFSADSISNGTIEIVPEPLSLSVLAVGGLLAWRRRR